MVIRDAVMLACALIAGASCLPDKRTLEAASGDDGGGSDDGGGGDDAGMDAAPDTGPTHCDLVKQTGCPGQKCTVDSKGASVCAPAGTRTTGQTCAGTPDNCVASDVCATLSGTPPMCRQFCLKNADCSQVGPATEPTNEPYCAFTFGSSGLKTCSVVCNPVPTLGVSGCPSGAACVYGNLNGVLATDCNRSPGAGTDGATCSAATGCADGYNCVGTHCRAHCRTGFDADCSLTSYTCVSAPGAAFGQCCPPLPTPCN
jgi:hypothetical protein